MNTSGVAPLTFLTHWVGLPSVFPPDIKLMNISVIGIGLAILKYRYRPKKSISVDSSTYTS